MQLLTLEIILCMKNIPDLSFTPYYNIFIFKLSLSETFFIELISSGFLEFQ